MSEYMCGVCGGCATERLYYVGGAELACDEHTAEVELDIRVMAGHLIGRDEIVQMPNLEKVK